MKQKKGISLIVLVITIIIMIIISGAIIITLTETNIIDRAETAVNKYNETELKQRVGLVFTEAQMAEYTDLEYSIEDNLKSIFEGIYGKDNITVAKSGKNYKLNVNDSKTTFRIKPDGSIQEYEEMDPTDVYARLDDQGTLYLRATEKEGYRLYVDSSSIQSYWNTSGDATPASVVKVIIEEQIAPTTASAMFQKFSNLETIENMQNLHTENATSTSYMFYKCEKLVSLDLSSFDTSKVKNMMCMFFNCQSLTTLDVSNFNTTNVTSFYEMFRDCYELAKLDVSGFNTENVKDMTNMFFNCRKLTKINVSGFDTAKITGAKLRGMFANCQSLTTLDVSNFDTTNVTSFYEMFYGCYKLTSLDISNFDSRNITTARTMFANCYNLKTLKLSDLFVINGEIDLFSILGNVPSDIKITATEETRDKLISASTLTEDNFEIIK